MVAVLLGVHQRRIDGVFHQKPDMHLMDTEDVTDCSPDQDLDDLYRTSQ